MSNVTNQHSCQNATYEHKNDMDIYICSLTGKGCSAQYYCHEQKKWRPTQKIKCKDFKKREPTQNS